MPRIQTLVAMEYSGDEPGGGGVGHPGGGPGGGGGGVGGVDTVNAKTKRWIDVTWTYTEPEPAGACTGFEVAVFQGTDIDSFDAILAVPIEYIDDPAQRRYLLLLELSSERELRAAVRACYGDFRSSWTNAAATAAFTPNFEQRQTDQGTLTLPDGTIMQWMRSGALMSQQDYVINWPKPFPHECYCVSVTTEMSSADSANDNYFMLRSKTPSSVTIYKQSAQAGSNNLLVRANIVGWGR